MKKRILSFVLVVCMLLSFVAVFTACKKDNTDDTSCTHTYSGDCDASCNLCGESREVTANHTYSAECDLVCDVCSATREATGEHTYTADCDATCNFCGNVREATADHVDEDEDGTCDVCNCTHTYDNDCDDMCDGCGLTRTVGEHVDDDTDEVCDVCGEKIYVPGILESVAGQYTYNDAVSTLASNWNPHTYQTSDDRYPVSFITTGLYNFVFNDAKYNVVEGKDPFTGYKIVPEMAAELPVDVTEEIKAAYPQYNIPESATAGYAYKIALNQNATWENGEKITADDYVYSMQQLLNPQLLNYRATDYYAQDLCIAGAEFYANQGQTKTISISTVMANEGLTFDEFMAKYGDAPAYVNWYYSFGGMYTGEPGAAYDSEAWAEASNEVVATDYTISQMKDIFWGAIITDWGYDEDTAYAYFTDESSLDWTYPTGISFDTVGIMKTGDYEITLVFGKSLAGFNLLYNLSGNWLVYKPYYEASLTEKDGAWFSSYNSSVETTMSYGPYKMTQYQLDKSMTFERNENWFGYTDGKHKYVDPVDGNEYDMYQTDRIYCQVVAERVTRKLMFLKGYLMGYGLGSEDFEEYRNSDRCYVSPSETIFFMILNGHSQAIAEREAAENFDTSKKDLETMTLLTFRKAVAVTFDKEAICTAVSPADSGGYGLFGDAYIYDPETGARYRDTDQAKKALCEFYSVDVDAYDGDLDKAVASITGYDPETAKVLYTEAFEEALAAGFITDTDGDGKSDQTIEITYAISTDSNFMTKLLDYLNAKMNEVTAGTPFENKIVFVKSSPLGNTWSNQLKAGMVDTVLGGWSGSALNPYSTTDLYVNPNYQYDAGWFDATTIEKTLTINGEEITMNLKQWSDALNGATVTIGEKSYCFGDGIADVDTRLEILAMIETTVLGTYNYIPMLQEGSMALLSKQVYYVVEEYNSVMGRGGITYMRYNFDDVEWADYVNSQGGKLAY